MSEEEKASNFYREFRKHMGQIDELANAILRGHLLVEKDLDAVMEALFYYPQFLGRLSFERKTQIARAMALRTQNEAVWETLASLNALRNEIVHSTKAKGREKGLARLRRACMRQLNTQGVEEHKDDDDIGIVTLGCALGGGYLGLLEEELVAMHKCLYQLDEQIHPDAERMAVKEVREGW